MSHNTRARRGGCALGALAAFTLLQSASVGAATVSWDGGGDGTSWSDPLNWSGDALPGPDDTAVLNVGAEPAVVLTGPAVTVAVLDCREALTLAGDGLTVTGAATVRSQVLRLEGGSLSSGGLTVIDGAFEQAGGAVAGDVTLVRGRLALAAGTAAGVTFHLRGTGTFTGELPADAVAALEGSVGEGLSRWSVEGEWLNRGTVRLTSVSDDFRDRGAYLAVPEGALFRNLPGGRVVAEPGAGDVRRFDGPLLNEGVVEATGVELQYRGALESRGGRYLGSVRILESTLRLTAGPTEATTLLLYGTANRLLSDIPADTTVQVTSTVGFGISRLTLPVGVGNDGVLRLVLANNDFRDLSPEVVVSEGTFTNRASGRLEVRAEQPDSRRFTGSLRNEGTIAVEPGITLTVQGTAPEFTQAGGALSADGEFVLESGSFRYTGGAVSGTVRGRNCRFEIGPGIAGPATLRAMGPGNVFVGNASPGVTLWVESNVPWGQSRLAVEGESANEGVLLLRTSSNDFRDLGCYLDIPAGARLHNRSTGRIVAEAGTGDGRAIAGGLLNEGSIEAPDTALEFRGALESRGGVCEGDVRFFTSDLSLTAEPSEPTTLFLYGPDNRLLTGIPAGTTVQVTSTVPQGFARLTLPEGVANDGVLRLALVGNDFRDLSPEVVVADGTFTNRTGGRLEVRAVEGDGRRFVGSLLNEGMIEVEEGITLTLQGDAPVFTQAAGSLVADGQFFVETGTFHLAGGELSGLVRARNSRVRTDAAMTAPGTVRMVGAGNVLERHEAREVALWIEGTTAWGLSRLTVPGSTVSAGTIHLTTTSNDFADRSAYLLVEPGMTLTNAPTGRITVEAAAGDSRNLTGHLWHQGVVEIGPETALNVYERLDLDGGSVSGELRLFNTDIATWRPASQPSVLPVYGTGNRWVGDVFPGYTVWIRGTTGWGLARLTAPEGFVNHGTIRLETANNDFADRSSHLTVTAGVLRNAVDGRIEILPGAGDGRQLSAELRNEGVLQVATTASLGRVGAAHANTGTIRIEGGATLTVSGSGLEQTATGRLEGVGTLDVQGVAYADAGTVSPGGSPGALTIRGNPAFGPSHRLDLEAAGVEAGVSLDRLAVDGTARLDGTLRLALVDDFVPAVGDVLPVLTFTGVRGAYGTVELPALPADRAWLPEYTTGAFRLSVIDAADATNRPPSFVVHPVPVTVVKGRTAEFFVTANGTAPLGFQWQRDGGDVDGGTGPVLTLTGVQPEQAGTYRLVVSNEAGTVTSEEALLTVLPAVGTLIPVEDAVLAAVPAIGGDGVEVDVYNAIGGGRAPTFEDLEGVSPTGSTPSPFIDFPRPGSTIAVGTSFDTFFADTTTPPASLSAVAAANFLLDHEFLLKVDPADDLHPDTPEVDIDLGVGSDDGFRFRVGSVELGSAGDRGSSTPGTRSRSPPGGSIRCACCSPPTPSGQAAWSYRGAPRGRVSRLSRRTPSTGACRWATGW